MESASATVELPCHVADRVVALASRVRNVRKTAADFLRRYAIEAAADRTATAPAPADASINRITGLFTASD